MEEVLIPLEMAIEAATLSDVVLGERRMAGRPDRTSATSDNTVGAVRTVKIAAFVGVVALTALGWTLSYAGLRQLAHDHGTPEWAATLWPACVDVVVLVATLVAVTARRRSHVRRYAWSLVMLYSAGTVAGNAAVAQQELIAQIVHATPAITMVLSWHLLSLLVAGHDAPGRPMSGQRRDTNDVASEATAGSDRSDAVTRQRPRRSPTDAELMAAMADIHRHGRPVTGRMLAQTFGLSDRQGQRLLARVGDPTRGAPAPASSSGSSS